MLLLFIFVTTLIITLVVNESNDESNLEIFVSILEKVEHEWLIIIVVSVIALSLITAIVQRLVKLLDTDDLPQLTYQEKRTES